MLPAVELIDVTKTYPTGFLHLGRRNALQGFNLRVQPGETFGLIGPNGAGKTTAFSLIFGFTQADSGSVTILGSSPRALGWKTRAGYLPEQPFVHDFLTPLESLENAGRLLGLAPGYVRRHAHHWVERVDLARDSGRRVGRLSKGMKQRLAIALALFGDPEFIVLDEPMSGLDPLGRALVRELIQELRVRERTTIFSTHILQDAEALCDRVGLISNGRLLAAGSLGELLESRADRFEITLSGPESLLRQVPNAVALPGSMHYRAVVPHHDLGRSLSDLERKGCRIVSVQPQHESLDELFARRIEGSMQTRGDRPS